MEGWASQARFADIPFNSPSLDSGFRRNDVACEGDGVQLRGLQVSFRKLPWGRNL